MPSQVISAADVFGPLAPETRLYALPDRPPVDLVVDMGTSGPDLALLAHFVTDRMGQARHARVYERMLEGDFPVVRVERGHPPTFAYELGRVSHGSVRVLGALGPGRRR